MPPCRTCSRFYTIFIKKILLFSGFYLKSRQCFSLGMIIIFVLKMQKFCSHDEANVERIWQRTYFGVSELKMVETQFFHQYHDKIKQRISKSGQRRSISMATSSIYNLEEEDQRKIRVVTGQKMCDL